MGVMDESTLHKESSAAAAVAAMDSTFDSTSASTTTTTATITSITSPRRRASCSRRKLQNLVDGFFGIEPPETLAEPVDPPVVPPVEEEPLLPPDPEPPIETPMVEEEEPAEPEEQEPAEEEVAVPVVPPEEPLPLPPPVEPIPPPVPPPVEPPVPPPTPPVVDPPPVAPPPVVPPPVAPPVDEPVTPPPIVPEPPVNTTPPPVTPTVPPTPVDPPPVVAPDPPAVPVNVTPVLPPPDPDPAPAPAPVPEPAPRAVAPVADPVTAPAPAPEEDDEEEEEEEEEEPAEAPTAAVRPPTAPPSAPAPAQNATLTTTTIGNREVTVVDSAAGLQQALEAGELHIQLRSHVDLRTLNGAQQGGVRFLSEADGTSRTHIAYIQGTEVIQGNCTTDPSRANLDATMQSAVPSNAWVTGQCMLVTADPTFLVMSGNIWIDKLILSISPAETSPTTPDVNLLEVRQTFQGGSGSNMFVTDSVFKGSGVAGERAIAMSPQGSDSGGGGLVSKFHSLYASDCNFEGFGGRTPPVLVASEAFAVIENSKFQDVDLSSELIDVSYGGAVKLANVTLENVTLRNGTGPIISTSQNDKGLCSGTLSEDSSALIASADDAELYLEYDDDVYDVMSSPGQGGALVISNGTMSDCLRVEWTCGLFDERAPPGCEAKSLQRRSQLQQQRCEGADAAAADVDLSNPPAEGAAGEAVGLGCGDYAASDSAFDPNYQWGFLDETSTWFSSLQEDLSPAGALAANSATQGGGADAAAADAEVDGGSGGGGGGGLGAGAAVGIAIALIIALGACIAICVVCSRKRKYKEQEDEETWRWYVYRGGDDDGASRANTTPMSAGFSAGFTRESGASSNWVGMSRFFGRSGRSLGPNSQRSGPFMGSGQQRQHGDASGGGGMKSLQDAFANMRMMRGMSGHSQGTSYSKLTSDYAQSPRSGRTYTPADLQSPRSGTPVYDPPMWEPPTTPGGSVGRPLSGGSVNYGVTPPGSDYAANMNNNIPPPASPWGSVTQSPKNMPPTSPRMAPFSPPKLTTPTSPRMMPPSSPKMGGDPTSPSMAPPSSPKMSPTPASPRMMPISPRGAPPSSPRGAPPPSSPRGAPPQSSPRGAPPPSSPRRAPPSSPRAVPTSPRTAPVAPQSPRSPRMGAPPASPRMAKNEAARAFDPEPYAPSYEPSIEIPQPEPEPAPPPSPNAKANSTKQEVDPQPQVPEPIVTGMSALGGISAISAVSDASCALPQQAPPPGQNTVVGMNTKASYNAIFERDGMTTASLQFSEIEVEGIKPAKTSNGMYINPLSAKAKSFKAKRPPQPAADSSRLFSESSRLLAESSVLGDDTASGMIDNQQDAGLRTEYRLKSFSAALKKGSNPGSAEEPRIPKASMSSAARKEATDRLPQLPEYSTMHGEDDDKDHETSSEHEQHMEETHSVTPTDSFNSNPMFPGAGSLLEPSGKRNEPSAFSNTAALRNTYASGFSGFHIAGASSKLGGLKEENSEIGDDFARVGGGGSRGLPPTIEEAGTASVEMAAHEKSQEQSGFEMTPPGSPGAFLNSDLMNSQPMSPYAGGVSKDHLSSDGGGGILMQIAADISAPLSGTGEPAYQIPADFAAQFGGHNMNDSTSSPRFALAHMTQQYTTARTSLSPPLSPNGGAAAGGSSQLSMRRSNSPQGRGRLQSQGAEVPMSPRGGGGGGRGAVGMEMDMPKSPRGRGVPMSPPRSPRVGAAAVNDFLYSADVPSSPRHHGGAQNAANEPLPSPRRSRMHSKSPSRAAMGADVPMSPRGGRGGSVPRSPRGGDVPKSPRAGDAPKSPRGRGRQMPQSPRAAADVPKSPRAGSVPRSPRGGAAAVNAFLYENDNSAAPLNAESAQDAANEPLPSPRRSRKHSKSPRAGTIGDTAKSPRGRSVPRSPRGGAAAVNALLYDNGNAPGPKSEPAMHSAAGAQNAANEQPLTSPRRSRKSSKSPRVGGRNSGAAGAGDAPMSPRGGGGNAKERHIVSEGDGAGAAMSQAPQVVMHAADASPSWAEEQMSMRVKSMSSHRSNTAEHPEPSTPRGGSASKQAAMSTVPSNLVADDDAIDDSEAPLMMRTAPVEPLSWSNSFVPGEPQVHEPSEDPADRQNVFIPDMHMHASRAVSMTDDDAFRSPAATEGSMRSFLAGLMTTDGNATPRTFDGTKENEFMTAQDGEGASEDSVAPGASQSSSHAPKTPSRDGSRESTVPKHSGGVLEAMSRSPGGAVVVGGENKAIAKLSRQLVRQLNRFKTEDQLFLQRFQMKPGSESRRFGGSSIVQFASTPADQRDWAIKFFLSPTAFENESVLYAAHYPELRSQLPIAAAERAAELKRAARRSGPPSLGSTRSGSEKFLPRVELSVGLHGGLMDPKGMPLPPCVVMERGENLLEWWSHVDQSRDAYLQVLSNVSKCVADIHGAGYVHRDFTPTSIVYQPTSMKFVPIGFSSSERVGGTRAHSFALVYAAPEVVAYADEHPGSEKSLEASTAMDAWSMGVIAVQLLTGTAPLDVGVQGVETVVAQLKGDELLPWEGDGEHALRLRHQLGHFKKAVLSLLRRNPAKRASLSQFQSLVSVAAQR